MVALSVAVRDASGCRGFCRGGQGQLSLGDEMGCRSECGRDSRSVLAMYVEDARNSSGEERRVVVGKMLLGNR